MTEPKSKGAEPGEITPEILLGRLLKCYVRDDVKEVYSTYPELQAQAVGTPFPSVTLRDSPLFALRACRDVLGYDAYDVLLKEVLVLALVKRTFALNPDATITRTGLQEFINAATRGMRTGLQSQQPLAQFLLTKLPALQTSSYRMPDSVQAS